MIFIKKDKLIKWIILFKILLDLVFIKLMAEPYSYYGYTLKHEAWKILLSWIILFIYIPAIVKLKNGKTLYDKVTLFLVFIYFIPGLSMYQFIVVDLKMYLYWNFFWGMLVFLARHCCHFSIRIKKIIGAEVFVKVVIVSVAVIVIYVFWRYSGLKLTITFTEEYLLRKNERTIRLPLIIGYLYSMSQVILTITICFLIRRRKIVLGIVFIFIQLCNFSIGGHKSILVLTLACVGIEFLSEKFEQDVVQKLILVFMDFELLLELALGKIFGNTLLMANISRRVYFVPQLLNTYYYDYSIKNGFKYYSSIWGKFINGPSSNVEKIELMVSEIYFGTEGNANNGLFSEAYSNLGLIGCIVTPLFILFVTNCLEVLIVEEDRFNLFVFSFICAFIWGSGNVTTGLVTNGILLTALLIFFNKKGKKLRKANKKCFTTEME